MLPAIAAMPDPNPAPPPLDQVIADAIENALRYTNGNKSKAAKILEIDRRALYRKLARVKRRAAKRAERKQ